MRVDNTTRERVDVMWKNDEYTYKVGTLRTIANNYYKFEDYEPIAFLWDREVGNPWELAEFKADFDTAWRALPRRMYSIVQYDIEGFDEYDLQQKGFSDPKKDKARAYRRMANYLNGKRGLTNQKVVVYLE